MNDKIAQYVRTIPDFPEKGIMFRDITTLLLNPEGFKMTIDDMSEALQGLDFDVIAGTESRGFIFGMPRRRLDILLFFQFHNYWVIR